MLRHLPPTDDPEVLVGGHLADDAAVYRLTDDLALVQSVDFFTPIVDDPYAFGQIAAANSLSDIYAMGAKPLTALNVVGFPVKSLAIELLTEILRGGADKAREAGVPVIGGHTVDDEEPKYGLAVTGTVHPDLFVTAHGARPGDVLVLTKPLGTGTIGTAIKAGTASASHVRHAVRWMAALNAAASGAMLAAGAHAATDITGFGLLGHLADLCAASGVAASVDFSACPLLPGALDYARGGLVPAGTANNLEALADRVAFSVEDVTAEQLLADPQTSGGLLVSLPAERVDIFAATAGASALTSVIGRIVDGRPGHITVTP